MKKNLSGILTAAIICALVLMLNVTAFASASAEKFSVKYDDNGANGAVPSDSKKYLSGEFAQVYGVAESTKGNRVFVGWSKAPGAVSADYVPGDKIKVQCDTTLYSVWVIENDTAETAIISNSGKIQNTPANTSDFFPDRSFVSGI